MNASQWESKVREVAIRKVAKVFDDADCDVQIVHVIETDELVMIMDLDFGMTQRCCCTEVLNESKLDGKKSGVYVGQVLDHMIRQLLVHTGRD